MVGVPATVSGPAVQPPRALTTIQLASYGVAYVIGGPVGIPDAVQHGAPLWVIAAILLIPVVYSGPQGLMAAEMGTMMPSQGGPVIWVTRAFGPSVGFYYAVVQFMQFIADTGAPVSLAASQLDWLLGEKMDYPSRVLLRVGILAFSALTALISIAAASRVTVPVTFLVALFVAAGFFASIGDFHSDMFSASRAGSQEDLASFFPTMLWVFSGMMSSSVTAGEIKSPTVLRNGLLLTVFAMTLIYLLTAFVVLAQARDRADWESNSFLLVAFDRINGSFGKVFGVIMLASTFLHAATTIMADGRLLWSVAELGWLPRFLRRQRANGSPYAAVLGFVVLVLPTAFINFDEILTGFYTAAISAMVIPPLALLRLRIDLPHVQRRFAVGGGRFGLYYCVAAPIVFLTCMLVLGLTAKLWVLCVVLGLNVLLLGVLLVVRGPLHAALRRQAERVRAAVAEVAAAHGGVRSESYTAALRQLRGFSWLADEEIPDPLAADAGARLRVPAVDGVPMGAILAYAGLLGSEFEVAPTGAMSGVGGGPGYGNTGYRASAAAGGSGEQEMLLTGGTPPRSSPDAS